MAWFAALLGSYLLGSIPTGYLVGRVIAGVDIREHGSGNMGGTNTLRVVGMGAGLVVAAVDMAKAALAVGVLAAIPAAGTSALRAEVWAVACGILSVMGHVWPVWMRFRGGKGVACAAGMFAVLSWPVLAIAGMVFVAILLSLRLVSVASLMAVGITPLIVALLYGLSDPALLAGSLFLAPFIFWTHRDNLARLLSGREERIRIGTSRGKTLKADRDS